MASTKIYGGNDTLLGLMSPQNGGTGQGVYSRFPAGTPKYHTGNDVGSVQSQARLYVSVGDNATYQALRAAVPERARAIFDVLATSSGLNSSGYFDFLLSSVSATRQEKMQVSEVLSDAFVSYFFGERAPMWSFSGNLLNTQQDEWYAAWHILYADILRGSKLARYGFPARLVYNNGQREVIGYLTMSSEVMSAQLETAPSLQFQMLIKRVRIQSGVLRVTNPGQAHSNAPRANPVSPARKNEETITAVTASTENPALNQNVYITPTGAPASPVALDGQGNFATTTEVRRGASAQEIQARVGSNPTGPNVPLDAGTF